MAARSRHGRSACKSRTFTPRLSAEAVLLREGRFAELNLEHLIAEIDDVVR